MKNHRINIYEITKQPTEDKYSILPIKIVGWTPKAAGEVIMLPKELTAMTGSDFDIDKVYVMLKEFTYHRVDKNTFVSNILNEYKKHRKAKSLSAEERDVILTWIGELFDNGKITTKYNIKGKEQFFNTIRNWIEKRWETRTLDENGAFEETVGNNGVETRASRNNKIFDIQWAVLTNEDTTSKMFNPGNFESPRKASKIIRAAKAGAKKSYEALSNMSNDELNSLSSKDLKNIVFSTSQVYYHKQNMTASKLVGVFANNNVSHAFLSMHKIHFNLKEDEGFTINGISVDNEHSNNTLLDRLHDHNGGLISKSLANLLAASVDAVKDPVLNYMNLNTFTCGPAMVLTRLGFDIDTIGLLMSQPIIEDITREYFRRNNDGYTSVEEVINDKLTEILGENYDFSALEKSVSHYTGFTSENFVKHINDNSSGKLSANSFQVHALMLYKRLSAMSVNLNNLTYITKFNSISSAVGPTIADTLVTEDRYQRFIDDMRDKKRAPFNESAEMLLQNLPIQNAFYESSRTTAREIFKEHFTEYSSTFTEILAALRNTTKSPLDSKTINKLVTEFILYKMTMGNNPIISGDISDRIKFIKNFPKEFEKRAEGIVDNDLINAIVFKARDYKCPVATLEIKSSRFSTSMQEKLRVAWTSLMENEDTFELGRDLFLYNLYRNGFSFSPKTFIHLFSVDAKLNESMLPYIEAISDPNFNDRDVDVQDFLMQFRRNHSMDNRLVPELKFSKGIKISSNTNRKGEKTLTIRFDKSKRGLNNIIIKRGTTTVFAPMIRFNNKVYYASTYKFIGSEGNIEYTETTELGNTNNFLEYNANEQAEYMESAFSKIKTKDSGTKKANDSEIKDSEDSGFESND